MEKVQFCRDCQVELICLGITDEENQVIGYFCPVCNQSYIETEDGFLYKTKEIRETC